LCAFLAGVEGAVEVGLGGFCLVGGRSGLRGVSTDSPFGLGLCGSFGVVGGVQR